MLENRKNLSTFFLFNFKNLPIGSMNYHDRQERHERCDGENFGEGQIQLRVVKLDFPKFSGNDLVTWVYKANQFFTYHKPTHNTEF